MFNVCKLAPLWVELHHENNVGLSLTELGLAQSEWAAGNVLKESVSLKGNLFLNSTVTS